METRTQMKTRERGAKAGLLTRILWSLLLGFFTKDVLESWECDPCLLKGLAGLM